MSDFRFVALGVGDAFSARWYSSCLLLEAAGARLLIDCPHPIRKILREAGETAEIPLDLDQISAVILTHLHADHASGIEGYAFYNHFYLKRKAVVLAHPEVAKDLWEGHSRAGMCALVGQDGGLVPMAQEDYFDIRPLSETAAIAIGPFQVECRRTHHTIFTTALRIRAAGRTLGYSADTSFDEGLIEWLSAADTIVHETNYGIHTPYARLAALPEPVRRKMHLIHYPDDFDLAHSIIPPLVAGQFHSV
jgi:ribonuclease BN (tRNA processing enzyme)